MKELVTKKGYNKLKQAKKDLEEKLKSEIRKKGEIHADEGWHESSAFEAAEENIFRMKARLRDIKAKLQNAQVVTEETLEKDPKTIKFGTCVTLLIGKDKEEFTILGEDDVNLNEDIISYKSPMAKALLGKEAGEEINLNSKEIVKILEIRKASNLN
ncbi:hypothetical protein GF360_02120 [candidate division WWE3 bacterium]|nr:hypothetical protein [candidate division WWE3 bacterium]